MRTRKGIALVTVLLAALSLLVVTVAAVSVLTSSNRKISGEKSVELQAQYAAESGAEMAQNLLEDLRLLFSSLTIDLGQDGEAAIYRLAAHIYTFCNGGHPDQVPLADLITIYDAIRNPSESYRCQVDPQTLQNDLSQLETRELGATWYSLFSTYIPRSVYDRFDISDPELYWGEILRGSQQHLSATVESGPEKTVRYRLSTGGLWGITPNQVQIAKGRVTFTFGQPGHAETLYSIGEVVREGQVVARRKVQIGNQSGNLLQLSIRAPSFAWFALFANKQPRHENPFQMIAFTDETVIDGPVHFNDYLVFEKDSSPWFGGPVSSAGPSTRDGEAGFYWRDPETSDYGFEALPPGLDAKHWWHLENANPRFAIAKDPFGSPICYNPVTKDEVLCADVDRDHDGNPDPPWEYKRAVNWDHNPITIPSRSAIENFRTMATDAGIFIPRSEFCRPPLGVAWTTVPADSDPPTECVGKYRQDTAEVTLKAENGKQVIEIKATKILGWEKRGSKWVWGTRKCKPPSSDGGLVKWLPRFKKTLAAFVLRRTGLLTIRAENDAPACPSCPAHCTCSDCQKVDIYWIIPQEERIVFEYTEQSPYLHVREQSGPATFVRYNASLPFNGVVFATTNLSVSGPHEFSDPPKPAVAEFAQITVASSRAVDIRNDIVYERPPCTETPHKVDTDGDGVPDQVEGRCPEEAFRQAAPNLLGIFGWNISLTPYKAWRQSDHGLNVHGVLMAYGPGIATRYINSPNLGYFGRFKLLGGMIQESIGKIGRRDEAGRIHGYQTALTYDRRMLDGLSPPGFPTFAEGKWDIDLGKTESGAPGFWRNVAE